MSDTALHQETLTLADYEAFVAGQPNDTRWELLDGHLFMMTNPFENHEQIVGGIYAPLRVSMDKAGCRVYAGGIRVQRSAERNAGDATLPDIVVRCGPQQNETYVTNPLVVVEVVSRSTMDWDRGPKLTFYKSLPTLCHIALVYQDQMRVEHYSRGDGGWLFSALTRPMDRLAFDAVGFTIDLDAIYFDVPVLRSIETQDPFEDEPPTPVR